MNNKPTNGYFNPATIKGIPIFIHWSFPAGGLFIAFFFGDTSIKSVALFVVAYTTLILIHELGQAIAAKINSQKVHAVLITASGGWCCADIPTSIKAKLLFFGGRLLAQLFLLIITTSTISFIGKPPSILNIFVLVFTFVNVVLITVNIYPSKGTDGKRLWETIREINHKA